MGKFYYHKDKHFKRFVFGINKLFNVSLYINGFTFSPTKGRSYLKKYDLSISFFPFTYQKIKY